MKTKHDKAPTTFQAQQGFTLIELMVTVAIIGIIASIAIPSYSSYILKSNRSAAESFILGVANKEEQYILDARQYAGIAALPGDTTGLTTLSIAPVPPEVSRNYSITIGGVTATTYTVTATPIGSQLVRDTLCGAVSINQAGVKTAGALSSCW